MKFFNKIYKDNLWGNEESRSGSGSTLAYTANLRKHLPLMVEGLGISSVFDAPCGDLNWISQVQWKVTYQGGDVVPQLVEDLSDARVSVFDVTKDPFPQVDLWICRDCLIHFSNSDITKTLRNFKQSKIKYALLTSHLPETKETLPPAEDILTGSFRYLNLLESPWDFPQPLWTCTDYVPGFYPRQMALWSRDQLKSGPPE